MDGISVMLNTLYGLFILITIMVADIIFTIWYKKSELYNSNSSVIEKILDVLIISFVCFVIIPLGVCLGFAIIESLYITFKSFTIFIISFLIFLLAILFCTDKQAEKIKNFIKKMIWNIEHKFNK